MANTGRIYDYTAFSSKSRNSSARGEYSFGSEVKHIDIDFFNRPEEYQDIDDSKAFVEYSVDIQVRRSGIEGMTFNIDSVELEFSVDDYPNGTKHFDMDFIPGKTIDHSQLVEEVLSSPLPTYPEKIEIDMANSTDIRKYKIKVYFGNDARYQ